MDEEEKKRWVKNRRLLIKLHRILGHTAKASRVVKQSGKFNARELKFFEELRSKCAACMAN